MGRVIPKRWVVKLGSGILTNAEGKLDLPQIKQLVRQVVQLEEMGYEVTIVSSGAVAAGMGTLKLVKRPTVMRELQACAAIGQPKLMALYDELFAEHEFHVAQLLLTYLDLDSRSLYANTQNTLNYLLGLKRFVPIINENDVVSYEEIKFGDNDQLSAHVAVMISAERLIILSNIHGLAMNPDGSGELVRRVKKVDASIEALAGTTQSERSVGGMVSKLKAARVSAAAGVTMQIANGREPDVLVRIGHGEEIGTVFDA
ncbi:MAG: glutamate 5-kinase [Candidatus Methylacidiphilales bacterium]